MSGAEASFYVIAYLVAINILVAVLAVVDRILAPHEGIRIPEKLLLGLSLIGGAVGAKLVQMVLRHKSLKYDYTAALSLIAIFQLAMAGGAWTIVNAGEERVTLAQILSVGMDGEEDEDKPPPQRIQLEGGADEGWSPF